MPGRSTTDQVVALRQVLQHRWEAGKGTHLLFIDFQKAYDCVHRPALYAAMRAQGVPERLINLVKLTQDGSICAARVRGRLSEFFEVESGVKQGDPLSPLLFNLALEGAIGALARRRLADPMDLQEPLLLAFADDLVLLADTKASLATLATSVRDEAARYGLRLSPKTEYMVVSRTPNLPGYGRSIRIGDVNFRRVPVFKYLGCMVAEDNDLTEEIRARVTAGMRSYYALMPLMKSRRLSRNTKTRLHTAIVRPSLTYGCESWTFNAERERRVAVAENNVLRRIAGSIIHPTTGRRVWRSNREVRELTGVPPIINVARRRRLQYAGHAARGSAPATTRAAMDAPTPAKRPRGRPRACLMDQIQRDADAHGIGDWRNAAADRDVWATSTLPLLHLPDPYEERREEAKVRREDRQRQRDEQDDA